MLSRAGRLHFRIFLKEFIVVFLVFCSLLSYQFYKKYEPTIFLTPVDSIPNELYRSGKEQLRTPEIKYENRLAVSKVVNREFKDEAQKVWHQCSKQTLNLSRSLEELSENARSTFLKHIAVDDDAKILYCVPSGLTVTSLEKIQQTFAHVARRHARATLRAERASNKSAYFTGKLKSGKTLTGLKIEEVKQKLTSYYKFMFAEEPISRLLFVYNTKIIKQGQKNAPLKRNDFLAVKQFRKFFTNFLYYVIASGDSLSDDDILPLVTLCQPCLVNYDFIGDIENFSQDLVTSMRQYHRFLNQEITDSYNSSMRFHANRLAIHVKRGVDKIKEDVAFIENCPPAPVDVIKKVARKYAYDFTLFGYKLQET